MFYKAQIASYQQLITQQSPILTDLTPSRNLSNGRVNYFSYFDCEGE